MTPVSSTEEPRMLVSAEQFQFTRLFPLLEEFMQLISYRREASFNFHTSSSHFLLPCVSETSAESSVGTS